MTSFIPTHLRHVPFGLAFTLNADDDLMCSPLRQDYSFSRDLVEYKHVDIDDDSRWTNAEKTTLMLILDTLMGEA